MDTELLAAVECVLSKPSIANKYDDAAFKLAKHFRAANPADNAEPITEEWLREIGGSDCRYSESLMFDVGYPVYVSWDTNDAGYGFRLHSDCDNCSDWATICNLKDRGQLRNLLTALNPKGET